MKKIIAAKVEQIIEFSSKQEADRYCEEMQNRDDQFQVLDYDQYDDIEETYRIRIVKSYNNNRMLASIMGLD